MSNPKQTISGKTKLPFWFKPVNSCDKPSHTGLTEVLELWSVGEILKVFVHDKQDKTEIVLQMQENKSYVHIVLAFVRKLKSFETHFNKFVPCSFTNFDFHFHFSHTHIDLSSYFSFPRLSSQTLLQFIFHFKKSLQCYNQTLSAYIASVITILKI